MTEAAQRKAPAEVSGTSRKAARGKEDKAGLAAAHLELIASTAARRLGHLHSLIDH